MEDSRCAEHGKSLHSHRRKHHSWSHRWPTTVHRGPTCWPRQTSFVPCTNGYSSQTEFALPRQSLGVSRINHILRVHGYAILQEQRAAEINDEVGQRSLERRFPDFTEDSTATLSADQSRIGYKRARDIAALAHLGALMAAKPRIQCNDHAWPQSLKQPLSTYLDAVDDEDEAMAKLYVQKAAQSAEEAWLQTVGGLQGPCVTNPTVAAFEFEHPSPAMKTVRTRISQRPGRADSVRRSSKRSFHRQTDRTRLRRVKDTLLSKKGAWQQGTRIEDLCHTHVSHQAALPPGRMRRKCLDAA